jgi:hypothetical protein
MSQLHPVLGINVTCFGVTSPVRLGDVVFYYANCSYEGVPQLAVVNKLQEGNLADLFLFPSGGYRLVPQPGIHLAGDPRLDNPNIKVKGSWSPRPSAEYLGLVKA